MNQMDGALLKRCITTAYKKLEEHKEEVNTLNVFPVPDGDTGTNMALTIKSAVDRVSSSSDQISDVGRALGNGSLMGARGNSGVILSQLCRGIADSLKEKETIQLSDVAGIFNLATEKAYKAVMKPTEGTILTVARSMSDFAQANQAHYQDLESFLKDVLSHANHVLQQTPEMLKELKEAGVVDAGGQGLIFLLAGFTEELCGESLDVLLEESKNRVIHQGLTEEGKEASRKNAKAFYVSAKVSGMDRDRALRHLTKYALVQGMLEKGENLEMELYTDTPQKVLDSLMRHSRLLEFQTSSGKDHPVSVEPVLTETPVVSEKSTKDTSLVPFGFVTVSLGKGFDSIFQDLMVNEIVSGGQTMNPSTADLLEAVDRVPANTVFLLPNNKNIIMAAEQVDQLTEKEVIVIPSRSIPQGITALFNFDEGLTAEENRAQMTESLSTVITGQITHAVRDTSVHGITIHTGDVLGLIDGEIVGAGQDAITMLQELLSDRVTSDTSLITIYAGEGADKKETEKFLDRLRKKWPVVDVEFADGGQPLYPYIFSIE